MIIFDLLKEYALILKFHVDERKFQTLPQGWKSGTKNPILLLPGFSESFVFLKPLSDQLHKLGYTIYTPFPLNTYDTIANIATMFAQYIRRNKLTNIICLSHSKGGLVAKYLLDHFPDINAKIQLSISLATPYGGSLLGYAHYKSSFEMIPKGSAIQDSKADTKNHHKIVALYPKLDNHVLPNKNLILNGAENIQVDIIGHTRILTAPETLTVIQKKLHELET